MRSKRWSVISVVVLASLLGSVNRASAEKPIKVTNNSGDPLRNKVVRFSQRNWGKKVGGGQCTDLVNAALEYAGAKQLSTRSATATDIANGWAYNDPNDGNVVYEWGTYHLAKSVLPRYENGKQVGFKMSYDVQRGEIIQFEGAQFEKPDKSQSWSMPHHTSIVVAAEGSTLWLEHQNAGGDGTVRQEKLDLTWLKKGKYRVYTPVAK